METLSLKQIARYDKDVTVNAFVVSKRGKVDQWTVEGSYVEPSI